MFIFEGVAYDLLAALVGALLGAGVAFGMVLVMAQALRRGEGFDIEYAVTPRSLVIAYALGVLLTLVVVAFSAWRVSLMTISTAIRNLPEPPCRAPAPALAARPSSALVARRCCSSLSGVAGDAATPLMLGISLVLVEPRAAPRGCAGVPDRRRVHRPRARDRRRAGCCPGASGRRSSGRSR